MRVSLRVRSWLRRSQAAVQRLVVYGKAPTPCMGMLRAVFLLTIVLAVLAAFVETVEPFTVGLVQIEASNSSAFVGLAPELFPDPGDWGCEAQPASIIELIHASGAAMGFVIVAELAYLAVFSLEMALALWAARLEVHNTRHTPRLKRAQVHATAIRRGCSCIQVRWWCSSLMWRPA
ncbi:hypothetical protein FNF27_04497 [Cafeteria roenbergensis]|uniref:Uncharacterized protein n=1 Tax=Cafeteria roenbergensis TaxID=33653 RepID=A0A5A8E871_CAFRO|nr:hypothetical protein FNF27_04497 [Cafeteria roenbergensis]